MIKADKEALPPILPVHVGRIMDGNGRWAQKWHLPRSAGHQRGLQVLIDIIKYTRDIGIPYLTVYAFSTENWKRPREEVDSLMELMRSYLSKNEDFLKEDVSVRFLGDISKLGDMEETLLRLEKDTSECSGLHLNIALNYGGRDEIVNAVKRIAELAGKGIITPSQIDEKYVSDHLYTTGMPDPDLIIRPSGEQRLSNFLPWQSAYSEFVFMKVLWPDFKPVHLNEALWEYYNRDRRFGGI